MLTRLLQPEGRRRSTTRLVLAGALLAGLNACDTGVEPEPGPTLIRFVNAAPDASGPLAVRLQGSVNTTLARGESTDYVAIEPGSYPLTVADGVGTWSIGGDLQVVQGFYQTFYVYGSSTAEGGVLLGDEPGQAPAGQGLVRFLHLAAFISDTADLHIAPIGTPLDNTTLVVSGLIYPTQLEYFRLNAGVYRFIITRKNTTTVMIDSGPLDVSAGKAYTAVFLNGPDRTPEIIRLDDGG
jgi:hypothetical protein